MGPLTILITVAIIVTLLLLLYALTPRSNNVTFGTTMGRDGMPLPPTTFPSVPAARADAESLVLAPSRSAAPGGL